MMPEVITGRVDAIEAPTGQAKAYQITIGGKKYRTIKPEVYGGLVLGQTVEAVVNEVPGKGTNPHTGRPYGPSWFLEKWKAVEGRPDPPQADASTWPDTQGMSKEDWAAKDRAVWMQSSYRSAAEFLGRGNLNELSLQTVARMIYNDVYAAWAGDDFSDDPVPRETAEDKLLALAQSVADGTLTKAASALDQHFGPKVPAGVDPTTGEIDGLTDLLTAIAEAPDKIALHKLAQEARGLDPEALAQVRKAYNARLEALK